MNVLGKVVNSKPQPALYLLKKSPVFLTVESLEVFNEIKATENLHILSSKPITEQRFIATAPHLESFIHLKPETTEEALCGIYNKVLNPNVSIETVLKNPTFMSEIHFRNTIQKQDAVSMIEECVIASGMTSRLANIIASAADEIIINSMFDSSQNEDGEQTYKLVPRNSEVSLEGKNRVILKYGFDGEYFAVSATDFHGSLNKEALLDYFSKIKTKTDFNEPVCGSGIGLSGIHLQGANIIFSCQKGIKTEVILFYKKTDSFKDFRAQSKIVSFNFK